MANKKGNKQSDADIQLLKAQAVAAAEVVYHYRIVGNSIGRDEDTIAMWRKKDAKFSEQLEQARGRFLQKQIKKSRPEFLLERLEPEIFKQRQDITSDDKPLTTTLVEFVTSNKRGRQSKDTNTK